MKAVGVSEAITGSEIKKVTGLSDNAHILHILYICMLKVCTAWYILEAATQGLIKYKNTKTKCCHPPKNLHVK
jgi:hypothetical protein